MVSAMGYAFLTSGSSKAFMEDGGLPLVAKYWAWCSGETMHCTASHARSWFSDLAPTPRLMPPSGGCASVPASTRGHVVHLMSSSTDLSRVPSSTEAFVAE